MKPQILTLSVSGDEAGALMHGLGLVCRSAEETLRHAEDAADRARLYRLIAGVGEVLAQIEGETGEDRDDFAGDLAQMRARCM